MLLIVSPFTCITKFFIRSVVGEGAFAFNLILLEFPFIGLLPKGGLVEDDHEPTPVFLPMHKRACILGAVRPALLAMAVLLVVDPVTLINGSCARMIVRALSMGHIIQPRPNV